jgi:hypothetical protein
MNKHMKKSAATQAVSFRIEDDQARAAALDIPRTWWRI